MKKYVTNDEMYIWLQPTGDRQVYAIGTLEEENQRVLSRNLVFIALSMGALMSVLYFYVTRSLTSPLERLMQTISKIRAGATELRADYQANDEIGMLAMEFNNMLDEVEALIGQQYEDKVLLNKAEYKALQAQSGYAEIRYSPG